MINLRDHIAGRSPDKDFFKHYLPMVSELQVQVRLRNINSMIFPESRILLYL